MNTKQYYIKIIFIISFLISFSIANLYAQVSMKKGKVYNSEKEFCLYKEQKIDKWTNYYEFTRIDKVQLFNVITTAYSGMKSFRITFSSIDTYFEVNYGNASIEDIITSYINNKIIGEDLSLNKKALEVYAQTKGIYLQSLSKLSTLKTSANAETYTTSFSSSGTNTQNTTTSSAPTSVSFSLSNTSAENVRIFIGDTPKYGSGTTGNVSGNSVERRTAKVGDQICIVDASDNPIACITVSQSMGDVVINKSGTGFGY